MGIIYLFRLFLKVLPAQSDTELPVFSTLVCADCYRSLYVSLASSVSALKKDFFLSQPGKMLRAVAAGKIKSKAVFCQISYFMACWGDSYREPVQPKKNTLRHLFFTSLPISYSTLPGHPGMAAGV